MTMVRIQGEGKNSEFNIFYIRFGKMISCFGIVVDC